MWVWKWSTYSIPRGLHPWKGEGKKCKADIIYFQNILIIQGNILDDVIN